MEFHQLDLHTNRRPPSFLAMRYDSFDDMGDYHHQKNVRMEGIRRRRIRQ